MKKNELKVSVIIENGMVRKEMVEIFYSEDYDLLNNFDGNRLGSDEQKESGNYSANEIKAFDNRVNKLVASMQKRIADGKEGFDKNFPILVAVIDGKKVNIDGQGRKAACKRLGIGFWYRILDQKFDTMKDLINYTISINTTASSWKITDKYKAWAIANDRKDLLEIMLDCTKKFDIAENLTLMVLFKNQNVCKKNNFNIDNIKIKTYTEQAKIDLYEILNFRQELINAIKGLRDSEGHKVAIKKEECLHAIVNFYCQNSKLNRTIAVKYVAEYYQKSDMKIFTANTTLFEKFLNRCALNHDEKI